MKKTLTWICLGIFLVAGIYASVTMSNMPYTYSGDEAPVSVYDLYQDRREKAPRWGKDAGKPTRR